MKKTSSDKGKSRGNNNRIDNPIQYFNKVIRNMNNKEFQKLKIIYKTEISMEFNDFDEQIISRQSDSEKIEDKLNNNDSLSWVEFLENNKLYHAVKMLRVEDLILLHMWVNQKYTQKEIACHLNMEEKAVNKRLIRVKKYLRKKLEEK